MDTSEYEKHQQSGAFLFKLANGDNVYQERLAYGGFYERVEENASAYGTYSEYYNNGKLKKRCRTFYGFMIGIQYNYDDTGNVISSKDFDSNYKFTTDDLVLKIKQTYHVNILDRSLRIIVARSNNSKPIYGIGIPVDCDYGNCFREIDIDGTNGEILSDKIKVYPIK